MNKTIMKYNNEWLVERFQAKERLKYLFFWGHQPSKDGQVTQSCFSQWWIAPFTVDGLIYPSAEHWMMVKKALLFDEQAIFEKIVGAKSPAEAKKMGRSIEKFDPKIWDKEKFNIVVAGNFYKFSQHTELKNFLLNTNERILVEASPVDKIWGIGMATDNQHIENPLLWKGENLLGYALMDVRDKLRG